MYDPDKPVEVHELPKKTPLWVQCLIISAFVLFIVVMLRYIWRKASETDTAAQAAASASASARLAWLEKEAWEKARAEKAEADFRAAKDLAFMQCRNQHDIPVMGFGFKVICVKAEAVAWEQKLEDGQPPP